MGTPFKNQKPASATALLAGGLFPHQAPSKPRLAGRRLKLFFDCLDRPKLDLIEYDANDRLPRKFGFLQRGCEDKTHSFTWSEMPVALSLFFLDYLCAGLAGKPFVSRRTPQTNTLGDAIVKSNGKLFELFVEYPPDGGLRSARLESIFKGDNVNGKNGPERSIFVQSEYLPPDCLEIFWERRPLTRDEVAPFTELFRKAWNLPPPSVVEFPAGEGKKPDAPKPEPEGKTPPPPPPTPPVAPEPTPATPEPAAPKPPPENATPNNEPPRPKVEPEPPALPRIDPGFFEIPESVGYWPDLAPLIELPFGEDDYLQWTIKNAFEGMLIMGRTGSGKTSGSGFTFAESFLKMGFGGLVLTVKKGEAGHWRRLCAHCGREKDLVVVSRGGFFKLNVLAYEAQHPGRSAGLSQNLTSFCRNLLRISSRSQRSQHSEEIWEQAGDELLNATFDLFLIGGGGVTFDRLAKFVSSAPTDKIPPTEEDWFKIPVFGAVLERAKRGIASAEDQRLVDKAVDYWCHYYPTLPARIRSSVTLGIYAMFDAFRGRDIPDLISGDTNMTPECIMSGLIVVLDLPLKEFGQAGLMVQSAWKYLFQTALERHQNLTGPKRRPVFLWEDEAQYFFSDHDHHFQDTARSSRVCRVVLTQNLSSFYKELGRDGVETANSVFGNLNTKVFHNNSHPETNEWAAKHFGSEIHMRQTYSHAPPPPARDFFDGLRQSIDPPNTTSVSAAEHWEYAVRPEEFNKLRTGGPENNYLVDAYITWMGLSAENDRHFTKMAFLQNPKL
jgi:hypothetical protein